MIEQVLVSETTREERSALRDAAAGTVLPVSRSALDSLLAVCGEQVILQSMIDLHREDWVNHQELLVKWMGQMTQLTVNLQARVLALTQVNMQSLFKQLERVAQDSAQQFQREVMFSCIGEATALDQAMSELLLEPLSHLVRNAVGHELEPPELRRALGKPPIGRVDVEARRVGGLLWIEVRDDGRGLDPAQRKLDAVENGLSSQNGIPDVGLSPGTDAIGIATTLKRIEERIQHLQGRIELEKREGHGVRIRMIFPLKKEEATSAAGVPSRASTREASLRIVASASVLRPPCAEKTIGP